MTLSIAKRSKTTYYRVRWTHNGESFSVRLGTTKVYSKAQAQKCHDMILALHATKVIAEQSFDKKQHAWLAGIDDKLHSKLVKIGLVCERAKVRPTSAYSAAAVWEDFIEYKSSVLAPPTMKKIRQSAEKFQMIFGTDKDMRLLTPNEAKNYARRLKRLGNGKGKPYADSTVAL